MYISHSSSSFYPQVLAFINDSCLSRSLLLRLPNCDCLTLLFLIFFQPLWSSLPPSRPAAKQPQASAHLMFHFLGFWSMQIFTLFLIGCVFKFFFLYFICYCFEFGVGLSIGTWMTSCLDSIKKIIKRKRGGGTPERCTANKKWCPTLATRTGVAIEEWKIDHWAGIQESRVCVLQYSLPSDQLCDFGRVT